MTDTLINRGPQTIVPLISYTSDKVTYKVRTTNRKESYELTQAVGEQLNALLTSPDLPQFIHVTHLEGVTILNTNTIMELTTDESRILALLDVVQRFRRLIPKLSEDEAWDWLQSHDLPEEVDYPGVECPGGCVRADYTGWIDLTLEQRDERTKLSRDHQKSPEHQKTISKNEENKHKSDRAYALRTCMPSAKTLTKEEWDYVNSELAAKRQFERRKLEKWA